MTDKLTPGMLRDLADVCETPLPYAGSAEITHRPHTGLAILLREEAARREAEATKVEYKTYIDLDRVHRCSGCDERVGSLHKLSCKFLPQVEREGLDSADAELAHSLRSVVTVDHSWPPMALSIIRRYEMDRLAAKDRIEAQAREIAELKRDQIETERSLVFWEKRADVAEAKAARLVIQMERAKIMIGARLDAMGPALREAEVNAAWHVLNAALSEAGHADNGGERGR